MNHGPIFTVCFAKIYTTGFSFQLPQLALFPYTVSGILLVSNLPELWWMIHFIRQKSEY